MDDFRRGTRPGSIRRLACTGAGERISAFLDDRTANQGNSVSILRGPGADAQPAQGCTKGVGKHTVPVLGAGFQGASGAFSPALQTPDRCSTRQKVRKGAAGGSNGSRHTSFEGSRRRPQDLAGRLDGRQEIHLSPPSQNPHAFTEGRTGVRAFRTQGK